MKRDIVLGWNPSTKRDQLEPSDKALASFARSGEIGGRCRIRTYDFHRVKVALYR